MKQSIEWHEDVLKNQKQSLKSDAKRIKDLQDNYARLLSRVLFCEVQIEEAKKRGKDGFDAERFMHTHNPEKR